MDKNREQYIENIVAKKKSEIEKIDDAFFSEVVGVSQAIGDLKEALYKVEKSLDERQFEESSQLGYQNVASAFIFMQRTLGGGLLARMEKSKS